MTIGKVKSSRLSWNFVFNLHRCRFQGGGQGKKQTFEHQFKFSYEKHVYNFFFTGTELFTVNSPKDYVPPLCYSRRCDILLRNSNPLYSLEEPRH